jgi:bifunctional oligoribonuclease and PAP phosphatase NrnA
MGAIMKDYKSLLDIITAGNKFLIVSHASPDGDALGSSLALCRYLKAIGKDVTVYNCDGVPDSLAFLPGVDQITSELASDATFDVSFMLDCAQRKRISDDFAALAGTGRVVCIDHHVLENVEADVSLIDSDAASAGEVVFRLIEKAGFAVDADIAQCIYTTLVVDTGFFKYSNTTATVLGLAARLVDFGASPWTVAKHLEESYPLSRWKLLNGSLSSLEIGAKGRYAHMEITQQMLSDTGAQLEFSDEFASYPRSIKGVEVAALFRETDQGIIKVSLRSKDIVDVAKLARLFGGGGHARAAGFRVKGSLDEAKSKVADAVAKLF